MMTKLKKKVIKCKIFMRDYPKDIPFSYENYLFWVIEKLQQAHIPILLKVMINEKNNNNIVGKSYEITAQKGTLVRYDDSTDFGVTIWEWNPNGIQK